MENQTEQKEVKTTKKSNLPFTLFACLATAFIVVLATNIGRNLEKVVAPETNTNNVTEKECNCEEKDTTTDSNSNTTTDSNSNTTTSNNNQTSNNTTQQTAKNYTESTMAGTYELKTDSNKSTIVLNKNGLYLSTFEAKNAGGIVYLGNYIIDNNTIYLNDMIQIQNGSSKLDEVVTVKIISKDEISLNGKTYKRTSNDYTITTQKWNDVITNYIKATERQ